jgi:hypothetical protein
MFVDGCDEFIDFVDVFFGLLLFYDLDVFEFLFEEFDFFSILLLFLDVFEVAFFHLFVFTDFILPLLNGLFVGFHLRFEVFVLRG